MDKLTHTFPYQYKHIKWGKVCNPLISISVKTSRSWQELWFLVDSGADSTMLTVSLADQLGLQYDKKIKAKLFGIGEKSVDAYEGIIILKLCNQEIKVRSYFIDIVDSTLLLGRYDIFDKFTITFNAAKENLSFEPI